MRLVYTDKIEEGAILARSIMNERDQVLLQEGVVLTKRILQRLIELGVSVVYKKNHENEVIEINRSVSDELRRKTKKMIQNTFAKYRRRFARSRVIIERIYGCHSFYIK